MYVLLSNAVSLANFNSKWAFVVPFNYNLVDSQNSLRHIS